jgi:WD40 repeat protein
VRWSPDGTLLAFDTPAATFALEIDAGGNPVGQPVELRFAPSGVSTHISWAPDGSKVVGTSNAFGTAWTQVVVADVLRSPLRLANPIRLTSGPPDAANHPDWQPVWI